MVGGYPTGIGDGSKDRVAEHAHALQAQIVVQQAYDRDPQLRGVVDLPQEDLSRRSRSHQHDASAVTGVSHAPSLEQTAVETNGQHGRPRGGTADDDH